MSLNLRILNLNYEIGDLGSNGMMTNILLRNTKHEEIYHAKSIIVTDRTIL